MQTLWQAKEMVCYAAWRRKNFLPPFSGKSPTLSVFYALTHSFINCQYGQNKINNTLFNSACIKWAITVCSASFLVTCRYSLCSYCILSPTSVMRLSLKLSTLYRFRRKVSNFHSCTHSRNTCVNISRHSFSATQNINMHVCHLLF